eukprot:12413642-Karenia_brevis.AAC.1
MALQNNNYLNVNSIFRIGQRTFGRAVEKKIIGGPLLNTSKKIAPCFDEQYWKELNTLNFEDAVANLGTGRKIYLTVDSFSNMKGKQAKPSAETKWKESRSSLCG